MAPESGADPTTGGARRITRNALSLSGAELVSRFFTWLALLLLTHHWTLEEYGRYATAINWVNILLNVGGLGLGTLAIREVARRKELAGEFLHAISFLRFLSSVFFMALLAALGWVLHYEPVLRTAMAILGLRLLFESQSSPYIIMLLAHERMGRYGLVSAGSGLVRTLGLVLVVWAGGGVYAACWVWVAVGLAAFLVYWRLGRSHGWKMERSGFDAAGAWRILLRSVPFAAFSVFQALYYKVDAVLLKSLSGNQAVALYDVAGRFLFLVYMVSDQFSVATLPTLSAQQENRAEQSRLATRALKFLLLAGWPLALGGCLLAGPLMTLLFGLKYAAAGPLFAVLALTLPFHFATKPSVNLLAVRSPRILTWIYLGMLLANLLANFIVIPRAGAAGAAWVWVAGEAGLFLACAWPTWDSLDRKASFRWVPAGLAACAVVGFCISRDPRLYWLAAAPPLYALLLSVLGALGPEDWKSLRSVLARRKGSRT